MDSGRKRLENEGFRTRYRKTVEKIAGDKGDKRSCFKSKLEIQIYKNVLYSESLDFVTTVLSFRQQQRPDKTSQNNNIPETSAPQEFDRNLNLSSKVYTLTNGTVVASKVYDVWLFARIQSIWCVGA